MNTPKRRSAKQVIEASADRVLARSTEPGAQYKLDLLATIASTMGWMDLFNKIQSRNSASRWWDK